MTGSDRIERLRRLITDTLAPLITSDYVLLDCPYHFNTGDTLIWRGERSFLSALPYKCLNNSSIYTWHDGIAITPGTIILLHGGGNFGDLWGNHSDFRMEIIKKYPENRIIIFPQTVYYQDADTMRREAEIFSAHSNLTICARDERSYGILRSNFDNRILLLPDMAFCIPVEDLKKYETPARNKVLYLERHDREIAETGNIGIITPAAPDAKVEMRDWPSSNRWSFCGLLFTLLRGIVIIAGRSSRKGWGFRHLAGLVDRFATARFMEHSTRKGVRFISRYDYIVSTRLHGAILSVLLGKRCTLMDNNYGKNSSFYASWLEDTDGIDMQKV